MKRILILTGSLVAAYMLLYLCWVICRVRDVFLYLALKLIVLDNKLFRKILGIVSNLKKFNDVKYNLAFKHKELDKLVSDYEAESNGDS